MGIYPDCPVINRPIEVGGLSNLQLIHKLKQHSVLMNELGERLLSDDRFPTSNAKYSVNTVELTVRDLAFPDGAALPQIFERASELGLESCPLELGPHMRLQYLDQPEGNTKNLSQQHQAPLGSITIATPIISEDDNFPKGFYLRKINGKLWLRGYTADHLHVWNPGDHFIFSYRAFP